MREAELLSKWLAVDGFRNVDLADPKKLIDGIKAQTTDCCVQLLDPSLVAGFDHLYFASLNALKASEARRNISKDLAVEVLLYASGQHQISKAIQLLGIKPDSREVAVLVMAETRNKAEEAMERVSGLLKGERCDGVIELTEKKIPRIRSAFNIGKEEIGAAKRTSENQAVSDLIVERCALLAAQV